MAPTPSTHAAFGTQALPDAVDRLAQSAVGLPMRRAAASGVVWRPGIAVATASELWRANRLHVVLPDGEPIGGEIRGVDPDTDLAAIAFEGAAVPPAERAAAAQSRMGDLVYAVGREASGRVQAGFGHAGRLAADGALGVVAASSTWCD